MLTITPHPEATTLINIFTVEPENIDKLVSQWMQVGQQIGRAPGVIGAALHKSADNRRLINYAPWRSAEEWRTMTHDFMEKFDPMRELASVDPSLYAVLNVESPDSGEPILTITEDSGCATLIVVNMGTPETLPQRLRIWEGIGARCRKAPGFLASALHGNADDTHIVYYAQWGQEADWQRAAEQAQGDFAGLCELGTIDARLYTILFCS